MTVHMDHFFLALQDIIRADEPAPRKPHCGYCKQGGRDDGGLCMHCDGHGNPEPWDGVVDGRDD